MYMNAPSSKFQKLDIGSDGTFMQKKNKNICKTDFS